MSFEGPNRTGTHYRPEIDGLRAIAVVAVMLYHAGLLSATGGYTGVDIFFVISGYLITGIILREKLTEKFSLIRFYERRARRILPALFLVLATCIIPALLYFDPAELQSFGSSLGASSLFSANFYFWRSAGGYFALTVERMPLLHLWSLAIEEQFYLLYPPFFLLVWRFARRWLLGLIIAVFCLSLALSEYASIAAPVANFFLLPTRGWELLAGCALAVYEANQGAAKTSGRAIEQSAGVLGLVLLVFPVFLYDNTTSFPGLSAIPPVVGSLLVIHFARGRTIVGKVLAAGPLVSIGLISYSAYLWHQPVLAFARTISLDEVPSWSRAALLLFSLLLAWLSWRLVEKPFRRRDFLTSRRIWILAASFTLGLLVIGAALWFGKGFPDRLPPRMQQLAQMNMQYSTKIDPCFFGPDTEKTMDEACKLGGTGSVNLAIIGDSHAIALAPAFEPILKTRGSRATLLVSAGCPPVLDSYVMNSHQQHCPAFNRRVLDYLIAEPNITTVALGGRWAYYIERSFYNNQEGGLEIGPEALWNNPRSVSRFGEAVQKVVSELVANGKQVVLIYPVPEPGWDIPRYMVHADMLGIKLDDAFSASHAHFKARNRRAYQILDSVGTHPDIIRVYPEKQMCNIDIPGRCVFMTEAGIPLYFDDDHLSITGARYALPDLEKRISASRQKTQSNR